MFEEAFAKTVDDLSDFLKPNPDADDIGIVHRFEDLGNQSFLGSFVSEN